MMRKRVSFSTLRACGAGLAVLALAGCGGGFEGVANVLGGGGQTAQPVQQTSTSIGGVSVAQLRADQLCPAVVVRPGTETLRLYDGEERTAFTVRYQAIIQDTAVECTPGLGQYALSIGVAGRALLGPRGAPANLDLPIRIVVLNTLTNEVISSEIVRSSVALTAAQTQATFSLVNQQFTMPEPTRRSDYQIIVGFDDASSQS